MIERSGRGRGAAAGPRPWRRDRSDRGDRGMVTAELAVGLPTLVVVVLAAPYAVAAVTAQLRCTDAAATAARLAARGEPASLVRQAALTTAPGGARLTTAESSTTVTATVTVALRPPGIGHLLPGLTLSAHVVDAREPTHPAVES